MLVLEIGDIVDVPGNYYVGIVWLIVPLDLVDGELFRHDFGL